MRDSTTSARWEQLNGRKGDLLVRCEQYARWTVPSLFTRDNSENDQTPQETEKGNVSIGARVVHHLAHRIVDTMFPSDKPFFSLQFTPKSQSEYQQLAEADQAGLNAALMQAENEAMRGMNLTEYRPVAVQAVSLNIVTGNALIYRLPNGKRTVYSVRDFCTRRSVAGEILEVMLQDIKLFGSLSEELQKQVQYENPTEKYKEDTRCILYTRFELEGTRWKRTQAVDNTELPESTAYFNDQEFPCLALTWNLGRGDDYGRGLVEDYAVTFHNVDVMTAALIDMIGIAADIKFLVNDASSFDIDAWNEARRGEYVPGKEGDITVPDFKFAVEIQVIAQAIEKAEREIAQAFLLSSAGVRDAERVTAEEIRFFAREIEATFGGLYSRLALEWQKKEAEYQLGKIKLDLGSDLEIQVTTGMETLTREGKLDALRQSLADLSMLDAVPQDIRAAVNPIKFASYIFRHRGVEAEQFLYTQEEFQANQDRELKAQQELAAQQGEQQVAQAVATKR